MLAVLAPVLVRKAVQTAHAQAPIGKRKVARALADDYNVALSKLLQLSFSREQEAEADRYALTLLDQNHINPTRMADFFSRAAKTKEGKQWQEMLEFLSTHPAAQARMDDIRQWAAEQKTDYQPVLSQPEWDALKNICND